MLHSLDSPNGLVPRSLSPGRRINPTLALPSVVMAISVIGVSFSPWVCASVSADPIFSQSANPDRDRVVNAAEAAIRSGDLPAARRLALAWLEAQSGDPVMLQLVGQIESLIGDRERGGQSAKALIAYRSAAAAFREASKHVDRGTLLKPSYHAWAYCLYRVGEFAEAIDTLQYSFDDSPADAERYALRARCHQRLEQWALAIADFTSALKRQPNSPELLIERADARVRLGEGDAAATELLSAFGALPKPFGTDHTWLLRWIFEFRLGQNDVDRAIAPLERIRAYAPDLGWVRLELGLLYYRKGAFDAAVAEFQPILDGAIAVTNYGLGRVYSRLGLIAQHNQDSAQAEKHFRRALELSPNDATSLGGLVACLRRSGRKDEAHAMAGRLRTAVRIEEDIRRVSLQIERNPTNRDARGKKIHALFDLERWEEAADEIEIYGRVITDGSVTGLQQELARRKRAAGVTP